MNEMIERAASAMYTADSGKHWAHVPENMKPMWRMFAREAIKAVRDPTDSMIEAGFQHTGDPCWPENVKDAWRAMIDEALK